MLCEVSKQTFEDYVDTYCKELFIKNEVAYPERILSFLDYSQEEENQVVAEEFIDLATDKAVKFRIKQSGY